MKQYVSIGFTWDSWSSDDSVSITDVIGPFNSEEEAKECPDGIALAREVWEIGINDD